jgi:enhancer of mRNA-decapping protein 3
MTAIEEVAETDFALPAATMTENAGRGIAEVTLSALNPGGRRLARENLRLNGKPMALFLVGNHKVGVRALAAARHVRNRGVRVVVCVLGSFWEGEGEVRREVDRLVRLGVLVRGWQGEIREFLMGRMRERGQPEIVVEALLGPGGTYERLGGEDQMALREMVGWINRGLGGVVVSVDCPSGVNASTGELASVVSMADSSSVDPLDDENLEVKAKHVVCIGAPRTGLLRALQRVRMGVAGRPVNALSWQIWVVDIGVNKAWKQCGIPGGAEGGVKFGPNWVVPVGFFDGSDVAGK